LCDTDEKGKGLGGLTGWLVINTRSFSQKTFSGGKKKDIPNKQIFVGQGPVGFANQGGKGGTKGFVYKKKKRQPLEVFLKTALVP